MKKVVEKRKGTPTNLAYIRGWDILARARVLAMQERRAEIVDEIRSFYDTAIRYEFYELVAEFSKYLYFYFMTTLGNQTRAKKYLKKYEKYSELAFIEGKVTMKFAEFSYRLNNTRSPSQKLKQELSDLCEELRAYLKLGSSTINIWVYTLLICDAFHKLNYKKVFELCNQIIQELEAKKIERTASFYKNGAIALMLGQEYELADQYIRKAIAAANKGQGAWVIFAFYQVLVALYDGNYPLAYEYYLKRNNTKIINRSMKEQWLILRGYFKFLSKNKILPGQHSFRMGNFLNSTPIFERDKSGNNINIIILQMLLEEPGWVIDKEDAIRKYMFRYMKSPELKRAKLLMQFLIAHAKHSYHPEALKRHAGPLLSKLKAVPLDSQNFDIEIIPFDRIAEIKMGCYTSTEKDQPQQGVRKAMR